MTQSIGSELIATWNEETTGAELDAILRAVLNDPPSAAAMPICTLEVHHAFDVEGTAMRVPILLMPAIDSARGVGSATAACVRQWLDANQALSSGRLEFTLTGFSTLPGHAGQPVVKVRTFVAPLA